MISLNVLIVGGAEMLIAININHHSLTLGIIIIIFLKSIILREWNFRYKSLVRKNNAEDAIPCAIIIIKAPINPIYDIEKIPHRTSPIWATDEYAIRDFKSFWRIQFNLVAVAPIKLILIIQLFILLIDLIDRGKNRIRP